MQMQSLFEDTIKCLRVPGFRFWNAEIFTSTAWNIYPTFLSRFQVTTWGVSKGSEITENANEHRYFYRKYRGFGRYWYRSTRIGKPFPKMQKLATWTISTISCSWGKKKLTPIVSKGCGERNLDWYSQLLLRTVRLPVPRKQQLWALFLLVGSVRILPKVWSSVRY